MNRPSTARLSRRVIFYPVGDSRGNTAPVNFPAGTEVSVTEREDVRGPEWGTDLTATLTHEGHEYGTTVHRDWIIRK